VVIMVEMEEMEVLEEVLLASTMVEMLVGVV
jgi:hypothetical protein